VRKRQFGGSVRRVGVGWAVGGGVETVCWRLAGNPAPTPTPSPPLPLPQPSPGWLTHLCKPLSAPSHAPWMSKKGPWHL